MGGILTWGKLLRVAAGKDTEGVKERETSKNTEREYKVIVRNAFPGD